MPGRTPGWGIAGRAPGMGVMKAGKVWLDPSMPLSGNSPSLWLRADYGTYQTNGGSAAAATNDPVGYWLDKSGNNRNQEQVTAGKRPTLILNSMNGYPVLRFTMASSQYIVGPIQAGAAKTLFIVAKKRSAAIAAYHTVFAYSTKTTIFTHTASSPSGGFAFYGLAGDAIPDLGGTPTNVNLLTILQASAASIKFYINGAAIGTAGDPQDECATGNTLALCANTAGGGPGDYDIPEVILYDVALSDADILKVTTYLSGRYGF